MKIQFAEIPVHQLVEGLRDQIPLQRKTEWDLHREIDQVPKPRHAGPAWSYQNYPATALIHNL